MKLTFEDVQMLRSYSIKEFMDMPGEVRFEGMTRQLTEEERRLVCIFNASLQVLNRNGAFKQGFIDAFDLALTTPDSEPSTDE